MADVTVKELADVVGTSVDRLLSQMKEAGLPQTAASQSVSDDQKQSLLLFLKKSHGEAAATPNKITLKRKVTTTLKTGQGGKKAVAIEVRKKRTYVKREELDLEAEKAKEEAARAEAAAQVAAEAAAAPAVAEAPAEAVAEVKAEAEAEAPTAEKPAATSAKPAAKAKPATPQRRAKNQDKTKFKAVVARPAYKGVLVSWRAKKTRDIKGKVAWANREMAKKPKVSMVNSVSRQLNWPAPKIILTICARRDKKIIVAGMIKNIILRKVEENCRTSSSFLKARTESAGKAAIA